MMKTADLSKYVNCEWPRRTRHGSLSLALALYSDSKKWTSLYPGPFMRVTVHNYVLINPKKGTQKCFANKSSYIVDSPSTSSPFHPPLTLVYLFLPFRLWAEWLCSTVLDS